MNRLEWYRLKNQSWPSEHEYEINLLLQHPRMEGVTAKEAEDLYREYCWTEHQKSWICFDNSADGETRMFQFIEWLFKNI